MGANLHQFLPTILNFLVIHPYFLTFVIFLPIFVHIQVSEVSQVSLRNFPIYNKV